MGILSWILFGLIAGAIAKFILPGKDPGGIIVTILLGIVGGLLGGWLGTSVFASGGISGFNVISFVWAVIGALIVLIVYRLLFHRSRA
ncbi:putative membrane protein YeaQ/YmgE (transglycosylase-associated protein family) [Saccharopolyspora lacisalsi]|uniref:Putative membrane protein YeaQ/YmgE (Transglycosylase-associated protein family) n=1 Tax=Halosaccharopolyspora lacisalsi TaxID=1000566 RepID=A0A839DZM4_9PSEU|nr:GlsB/YeaQ/YmgE family stress response membrane protein [Halosaccharopolyspora lacisalsi]MBA8824188.1 putative membrane protein YeaQ/YmgE (transglycosylase-associated protein family) [Halosaccharopolyspora lacisalsi]